MRWRRDQIGQAGEEGRLRCGDGPGQCGGGDREEDERGCPRQLSAPLSSSHPEAAWEPRSATGSSGRQPQSVREALLCHEPPGHTTPQNPVVTRTHSHTPITVKLPPTKILQKTLTLHISRLLESTLYTHRSILLYCFHYSHFIFFFFLEHISDVWVFMVISSL